MGSMVHVTVVGTGWGERVVLPAFSAVENARVNALVSRRPRRGAEIAERYGVERVCGSVREALEAGPCELLVVTGPPETHEDACRAAFQAGVPVLCEKPLALDFEAARRLQEAAAAAGTPAVVDHQLRFHPACRRLREEVRSGALGDPERVGLEIRWSIALQPDRAFSWWDEEERGGGILGALGSHFFDLVHWILGPIEEVGALLHHRTKERPGEEGPRSVSSDDHAQVAFTLAGGGVGSLVLDAGARPLPFASEFSVVVHGPEQTLALDGVREKLWRIQDGKAPVDLTPPFPCAVPSYFPRGAFPLAFLAFLAAAVPVLSEQRRFPRDAATFEEGTRVQAVLDAARRSAREGRRVRVSGPGEDAS